MSKQLAGGGEQGARLDLRGCWPLVAACLLALVLQLVVHVRSPLIALDGIDFIAFARDLEQPVEAMRANPQHPGYPLLIRAAAISLQEAGWPDDRETWILAARLVAMLAGVLIVALVWQLARGRFGLPAANAAAVLCAAWPLLRRNAADALSDSPHLVLYLAGACCFCAGLERRRARWFAAAGLCAGLAYWVRPEGLSLVIVGGPLLALMAVGELLRREWRCSLRAGGWAAAAVGTALVVIAPYLLVTGKFSDKISNKFNTTPVATAEASTSAPAQVEAPSNPTVLAVSYQAPAESEPAPPITPLPPQEETPEQVATAAPSATLWGVPLNSISTSLGTLLSRYFERAHLLAALAGVAVLVGPIRRPHRAGWYLIGLFAFHALLLFLLFTVAGYIDRRHVLPLVALTFPLAGQGLCRLCQRLAARVAKAEHAPRWGGVLASGVLALVTLAALPRYAESNHYEHLGTLQAVQWANEHLPSGALVVTNSRYAPFYLEEDRQAISLDGRVFDSLADHASPRVPCYLLLVENQEPGYDPHWWEEARLMGPDLYHTANTTRRQTQDVTCWQVPAAVVAQLTSESTTY